MRSNINKSTWLKLSVVLLILLTLPFTNGCTVFQYQLRPPVFKPYETIRMQVTGYCACEKCCGWERDEKGRPVYAYGPLKGQRKIIGKTAAGTRARRGAIAADTNVFPMGTIMYVEGYGYGVVEDRGSAIVGRHIDLFFKSHDKALEWGKQTIDVKVWLPPKKNR